MLEWVRCEDFREKELKGFQAKYMRSILMKRLVMPMVVDDDDDDDDDDGDASTQKTLSNGF